MKKKPMNNKGFSLVELIIVIAIMAVLVAVLAPQYTKYVEKSRISSDIQTLDEVYKAAQVITVDSKYSGGIAAVATEGTNSATLITISNAGVVTVTSDSSGTLVANGLKDLLGLTGATPSVTLKSSAAKADGVSFTINFKKVDGGFVANWSQAPADFFKVD